jgi:hypothetical protein
LAGIFGQPPVFPTVSGSVTLAGQTLAFSATVDLSYVIFVFRFWPLGGSTQCVWILAAHEPLLSHVVIIAGF